MTILCLGDSMTYGVGVARPESWVRLAAESTGHQAINRGLPGDTTTGMLMRLPEALAIHRPGAVMILGGSNDFMAGGSPGQAAANYMAMCARCAEAGAAPLPATPLPADGANIDPRWGTPEDFARFNALLSEFREAVSRVAAVFGVPLLDLGGEFARAAGESRAGLYLDGLHLNARGHGILAEIVAAHWDRIENI